MRDSLTDVPRTLTYSDLTVRKVPGSTLLNVQPNPPKQFTHQIMELREYDFRDQKLTPFCKGKRTATPPPPESPNIPDQGPDPRPAGTVQPGVGIVVQRRGDPHRRWAQAIP